MTRSSKTCPPSHPLQRRLLAQLQLERRAHGHGRAAELDQRIGKSEGYIGRVLRGEIGLQTEQLFKMLDVFGVEPATFFAAVVGADFSPRQYLRHWARTLERTSGGPALFISNERQAALNSLLQPTRRGGRAPETGTRRNPALSCTGRDAEVHAAVRRIADLKFSAEGDALSPAAELLATTHDAYRAGRVSGNALARVLELAASVERSLGHAGTAMRFLRTALEVVERSSDAEIRLWVEAVAHLAPRGQRVAAELMIDVAQRRAIQRGTRHLLGKTLRARADVALANQLPVEALESYRASFRYLRPEAWQEHFLANQGAARCHLADGALFRAGRNLARAEALHPTRRGPHWATLQWVKADWARANIPEDLELAADLYDAALLSLDAQRHPLDGVAIHLQRAKVLLALGAMDRLRCNAASALQLTGRLKTTSTPHGLLLRFATLAMTGELTQAWLDHAVQGVAALKAGRQT